MTHDEWAEVATLIHEAYGKPVTQGYVTQWWPLVAGFDRATIEAAFMAHAKTDAGRFLPLGGQLAELADEVVGDGVRPFDDVWSEIMDNVRRIGSWGAPEFSEEARQVVRFLGGWRQVCSIDYDGIPTSRAQARDAYKAMARRATVGRAVVAHAALNAPERPVAARLPAATPSGGTSTPAEPSTATQRGWGKR